MKIDVITLHNVKNYGSVLQSIATQTILEKKGYEVEFINYYRNNLIDDNILKNKLENSKFFSMNCITKLIGKIVLPKTINKQIRVFNKFVKEYIKVTKDTYYSYEELEKNVPKADIYCTGSDQMWNAEWNNGIERAFYLDFLPDETPRFALSSSFGRNEIKDEDEEKEVARMLKKYKAISVRESSGVNILNKMGIKDAEHVLDPTLLLDKNMWQEFVEGKELAKKEEKYILVYQLNMDNKEFDEYVKKLSKEKKLPVIRVSINNYQKFKYGKLVATPEVLDFLDYFLKAEYIITDSFHGTAFSINLNKKFICIFPKKFSARLQSILELTGLEDRKLKNNHNVNQIDNEIDYDKVNEILEKERNKTNNFIDRALELCKE